MLPYDRQTHHYTIKRDRSQYFTLVFLGLIILALSGFGYFVILNSPRIMFYFRENKYTEIEHLHKQAIDGVTKTLLPETENGTLLTKHLLDQEDAVSFVKHIDRLAKDHRDDPHLQFYTATFLAKIFSREVNHSKSQILALLFSDFIGHPKFPKQLDHELWQRAWLAARRVRALDVSESLKEVLLTSEADLALVAGRPYWLPFVESAGKNQQVRKTAAWQLIQSAIHQENVDFNIVQLAYGETYSQFFKGLHLLRTGNAPLGISLLRDLSKNDADVLIKDHALYVLAHLAAKDKRIRDQLHYLEGISFETFSVKYPFMVPELLYLMRFVGKKAEADRLLKTWENLIRE